MTKRKSAYHLFLISCLVAAMIILSCNKPNAPDCIQRAGSYETEMRTIQSFREIHLRDFIKIELYDSTETFVTIHAPRNLIPDIETRVEDGKLTIHNNNTCNMVRSLKNIITVRIYAPSFPYIYNAGTGDIVSVNTLRFNTFELENRKAAGTVDLTLDVDTTRISAHSGVADVIVRGNSVKSELFEQGYGWIHAQDLKSRYTFVNNSSLNEIRATADEYLFSYIKSSGNTYYSGTPNTIDEQRTGNGQLIHIN
jgi:Putative auto-transporter adhesin, head GIN domain